MEAKIKVIIKRPDEKIGHVTNISQRLENLQKTVEGYIEVATICQHPKILMILNEEGKLLNLERNFKREVDGDLLDVIRGTVIICGESEDGEEFADIPVSFEIWKQILKLWGNDIS